MKRINFIDPVPTSRTTEVRIWYWLCLLLSSVLFLSITIISGTQGYLYYSLYKQKQTLQNQHTGFEPIKIAYQNQQAEQEQLQKKFDRMKRYRQNPKNPIGVFALLRTATENMTLQNTTIDKKQFTLHILCPSTKHAALCIKKLHQNPSFTNVVLTSLQGNHDNVQATIKGSIITKLRA